jgi:hypothetical protein
MRILLMMSLGAILAFSSCVQKKSYTCACTGGFAGTTTKTEIKAKNRAAAQQECKSHSSPPEVGCGFYCELE